MSQSTVLITGAGSGIGAATAQLFSEKGHKVILVGRQESKLRDVAARLSEKSQIIVGDVCSTKSVQSIVEKALKTFNDLSFVVNNAGIYKREGFLESSEELWLEMIQTNVLGPVRLLKALLPHLRKRNDATVVNVGSTAGMRPILGMAAYTTSKAALIHLTQSLALEFAKDRVRFHCVCPGIVDTPIHHLSERSADEQNKIRKMWNDMHPLGFGKPEDVAQGIYYLTTQQSHWMTGVVLPVDGGLSLI